MTKTEVKFQPDSQLSGRFFPPYVIFLFVVVAHNYELVGLLMGKPSNFAVFSRPLRHLSRERRESSLHSGPGAPRVWSGLTDCNLYFVTNYLLGHTGCYPQD